MKRITLTWLVCAMGMTAVSAQSLKLSIGLRETGGTGPVFANGGSANGIEFVNRDGQTLIADGTWQLFTFTPSVDTLTAFAGATANGVLDSDWAVLENIRILNFSGITSEINLWIDDLKNTDSTGSYLEGFESFAAGAEVIFQEPRFSGSTAANLLVTPNSSLVTGATAFSGAQSDEMRFQFIDNDPTRWVRLTTFNTPNLPNPLMHVREGGFAPTISFYAKAIVVPEPAAGALIGLGMLALLARIRRR